MVCRPPVVCFILVAIVLLAQPSGAQQPTGTLAGTVSDPSNAVLVGAVVRCTNLQTSAGYESRSDTHGIFRFLVLPPGLYEVRAEAIGFRPYVQPSIDLGVGAKIDLNISLAVGASPESVAVSSYGPLVETTRSSVSTTVDQRSLGSLPLNGRNFLNFVLLTPGVTTSDGPSGAFFSVGGQLSMSSLLVDGVDQHSFNSAPVGTAQPNRYLFSQEAVQEFQVNTNSYSAEFAGAGTSAINVITKSGTNDWHGAAFWYYRDRGLNATDPLSKLHGQPKAPFHAHQFGGAVGGPIRRDRLFFFASYDGQRRAEQNLTLLNLPSGFALSPNPTIAGFQQMALEYLTARAESWVRTFDQNVLLVKADWSAGRRHRLSAAWNRHRLKAPNFAMIGQQQSLEHTGVTSQMADVVSASLTSVLSSTKVNVARFAYVNNHSPNWPNSSNPEANVFEQGQQVLVVGRATSLAQDNGIRHGAWSDILSLSRGRHGLKFGATVLVEKATFFSASNFAGSYRFSSLESFGRSLAQLPICPALPQCRTPDKTERYIQAFSALGTPPIDVHPNYVGVSGFAQDDWRVRPSLTLSLGLLYETQLMANSQVLNPAPALLAAGVDTRFVPTDLNNLEPRIGFAWSPGSNPRLVIRGGYGLYFPRFLPATAARAFFQNGLTVQTRTLSGKSIPAYPNTVCGPPDPSGALPNCPAPAGNDIIQAFPYDYRQTSVQQGSFGVEYELLKDLAVSATYMRVKATHLDHYQDINLQDPAEATIGIAGTSTTLPYRLYPKVRPITPGFDRVLMFFSNGNSSYHGLALKVNKRFSRSFQLLGAYTLSKVIDDNPTLGNISPPGGDGGMLSDPVDARLDRGAGSFDQRHRLVASGVWELHYGDRLNKGARAILSGWQISGILAVDSGQPYSGMLNFDLNNDGNAATDRTPALRRNTFYLPTTVSLDPRITRKVALSERVTLAVNWDAFNLFNRANYSSVRTTMFAKSTAQTEGRCAPAAVPCLIPQDTGTSAFGTPTGANDPRIMQFSAVLRF